MSLSKKQKIEIIASNPNALCAAMRTSRGPYVFAIAAREEDALREVEAMNERFGKSNPSSVVPASEVDADSVALAALKSAPIAKGGAQ